MYHVKLMSPFEPFDWKNPRKIEAASPQLAAASSVSFLSSTELSLRTLQNDGKIIAYVWAVGESTHSTGCPRRVHCIELQLSTIVTNKNGGKAGWLAPVARYSFVGRVAHSSAAGPRAIVEVVPDAAGPYVHINDYSAMCDFAEERITSLENTVLHLSAEDTTDHDNEVCNLVCDKLLMAMASEDPPSFGGPKMNEIVQMYHRKRWDAGRRSSNTPDEEETP